MLFPPPLSAGLAFQGLPSALAFFSKLSILGVRPIRVTEVTGHRSVCAHPCLPQLRYEYTVTGMIEPD